MGYIYRLIGNFCSFAEKGAHIINVSSWKGPIILLIISQGSQVSRWQTNKDNWQWNFRNPADKITQRKRQLWKAWEDEQCFKLSAWNWKLSQMLHLHITAINFLKCYIYISLPSSRAQHRNNHLVSVISWMLQIYFEIVVISKIQSDHPFLILTPTQAGTSCTKLTSRLWGPTEFMRTKR